MPDPGLPRASAEPYKRSNTWGSSSSEQPGPWSRTVSTPPAKVTSIG